MSALRSRRAAFLVKRSGKQRCTHQPVGHDFTVGRTRLQCSHHGTSHHQRQLHELKAVVGEHLGYSEWMEITQERVNQFAEATGDHQWIHVDRRAGEEGEPVRRARSRTATSRCRWRRC